jgi:hypothetical protein
MGSQNQGKLNRLQQTLPEGLVVDSGWLERHGVSRQLRRKYAMHGWLLPLARGVYCRSPLPDAMSSVPWQQLVISLNYLQNLPVAAGARTALELQGFSHYVSSGGSREAHLYANEELTGWVLRVPVDTKLVLHKARKLFRSRDVPAYFTVGDATPSPPEDNGFTQQQWGHWKYPLTQSTPERAILELLDEVPKRETFHQADVLMEGLRNLSPRRLQALLSDCRSVKVKRLFFWFAERHNHAWLQKLDRAGIDLGKGKRMLVRGGKFDPKYNITVPENLDAGV